MSLKNTARAEAPPSSSDTESVVVEVAPPTPLNGTEDGTEEAEAGQPKSLADVFREIALRLEHFTAQLSADRTQVVDEIGRQMFASFFGANSKDDFINRLVYAAQAKDDKLFEALIDEWLAPTEDKAKLRTTPGLLSGPRPLQTQHGFARVEQAYADKNFEPNRDGDALVHRVKNADGHIDPVDVFIAPINSRFFSNDSPRFFPPPTLPELLKKLDWIGSSGPFTFAVVISLAVECDRPQVNLNDLMKELGLDPRSQKERDEYRALLWQCLQLFAQTLVVGKVQGKYRDKKGNLIEHIEKAPVIAITGTEHPSEMRLDRSEAPVAVEYTLGSFYHRHRDNKQFLAFIGDLRLLAGIPGAKPPDNGRAASGLRSCNIGAKKQATPK